MLQLNQLSLRRGSRLLFQDASFTLYPGQRLGLVGANGCGKSSLFALLRGELEADSGGVQQPPRTVMAHVAQETPALDCSALDFVMDGDNELRRVQQSLAEAQNQGLDDALPALYEQLEHIDGYRAEQRAARLLHGLGFSAAEMHEPVNTFSGGWRMRLNLAQALMCRSDLLLLDEPTNHLDLPAIVWLERWLLNYTGMLMIISHDRDFLDGVCTHIAHIEHQAIRYYTGNYSQFETLRAEQLAQQQVMYQRQQRQIQDIQKFITRFKAKASKAKQAQSRVKMLERMSLMAPAHADSPFSFRFLEATKQPTHLLKLEHVAAGYLLTADTQRPLEHPGEQEQDAQRSSNSNELRIVDHLNLSLTAGDRVGLLGMNGAGKSTVMKAIADGSTLLAGERLPAQDCIIGYFAQHQVEQLEPGLSAFDHLRQQDARLTEQEIRNFLGGFDFHGDRIFEPVAPFSGGEKARLVLALIIQQRPNLLLLDEPTNHLDLQMRQALGIALQDFQGALVIIAHDRHLLRSACDELYLVHEGRCQPYQGDLDNYADWLNTQNPVTSDTVNNKNEKTGSKKNLRQYEAEKRRRLKPFTDRVRKAEQQMEKLRLSAQDVEARLGDTALYTDASRKDEMTRLLKQQAELKQALDTVENEWLMASEQLEHQQSQFDLVTK